MLNRYIVYKQYEYWGKNGKQFTEPFRASSELHRTEESAKNEIVQLKETSDTIKKATKLDCKYEIRLVDVETLPTAKPHYGKSGRPTKAEKEAAEIREKMFWVNKANEQE